MARPKKDDSERKDHYLKVRLTANEKEIVKKVTHNAGYDSVSDYIRDLIHMDNPALKR